MLADLLADRTGFALLAYNVVKPQVDAGKLRHDAFVTASHDPELVRRVHQNGAPLEPTNPSSCAR